MDANGLRRAFLQFFEERGHTVVASAGLVPHHPRAPLFTNAGMNQFIPYFLGEEVPPYTRATSVQKCVRIRGKHDDIDLVGRTTRHFTFFEMLGNFSFGDYFKQEAIPWAWDLLTGTLGLDGDRLWVTVYPEDEEAVAIWRDTVGLPASRIVADPSNFWEMGETGPCGPDSEVYYDRGPDWGEEGGPLRGGEERYLELWNLVFPQFDRQADGTLLDLPKPGIDTGAGLERILTVLEGVRSGWETGVLRPIIAAAESLTGRRYGDDAEADVALRILADHARSVSFLIADGVFPSNEDRGYVLRRLIRRAVRQAYQLGVGRPVMAELVEATVQTMGAAYPDLASQESYVASVADREEHRFLATLRSGLAMLEEELAGGKKLLAGEVAFRLHDTHGFPVELTREIAAEKGAAVDEEGFARAMEEQRRRSKDRGKGAAGGGYDHLDDYRALLASHGQTRFVGYETLNSTSSVLAVLEAGEGRVEIFLDVTPFYAEGGGQVGDTGVIETDTGRARVLDTTAALPGLHRHLAVVEEGEIRPGQAASASVDAERRAAIRRNHTGTHLLHWALREVLGSHVKQQGSLVAPDRLRFDFTHYGPATPEELARVEDLVNARILADLPVKVAEMPKAEADAEGAIAFFDEKYGDVVRVVRAGEESVELCGGTHVERLGQIGPLLIVSEGSIGSNLRRVEAITGTASLARLRQDERLIAEAASLLGTRPEELVSAVSRRLSELREAGERLRAAEQAALAARAHELAAQATDGVLVARVDGLQPPSLAELASQLRKQAGLRVVVLGGSPDGSKASLVAMVAPGTSPSAPELLAPAARTIGGGGGGNRPEQAMAGGRDPSRLDEALEQVRRVLSAPAP